MLIQFGHEQNLCATHQESWR